MIESTTTVGIGPTSDRDAGRRHGTEKLRRFLEAYWLRPENALWMTLRSLVLESAPWAAPSIDVSCGDGVFSFLHHGGVFDPSFDVFGAADVADAVKALDADIFDYVDEHYQPAIRTAPRCTIDVGTDCKPSMLEKAGKLGLYRRLVHHDNNEKLPFEDESFRTVYCNAAYWVRNIDGFLSELARITRPDGFLILQVKMDCLRDYTLRFAHDILGDRVLDLLERGRFSCWVSLADRSTWERRFRRAGLHIRQAVPFITRTHAQIWDIGLRPVAPLLMRMVDNLRPDVRETIKRDWVDLFLDLLTPFCDPSMDLFEAGEPGEIQYVLSPGRGRAT